MTKSAYRNSCQSKAFTLIELLVVIAIIGLISSVILASLNSTRRDADAVRLAAGLREMHTAIELYYDENGAYPYSDLTDTGGNFYATHLFYLGGDTSWGYMEDQLVPYLSVTPPPSQAGWIIYRSTDPSCLSSAEGCRLIQGVGANWLPTGVLCEMGENGFYLYAFAPDSNKFLQLADNATDAGVHANAIERWGGTAMRNCI